MPKLSVADQSAALHEQGVFLEAVRVSQMPMVFADPELPGEPVVFANDAFLQMSCYALDEALGREALFLAEREGAEDITAAVQEMLTTGRNSAIDLICRRKDGTRIPVILFGSAILDGRGRAKHFYSYLDTTAVRTVQRLHSDAERQFRFLVEGASDYAIYMLDAEGRITSWNAGAERIKGYAASEVLGQNHSLFYTNDDRLQGAPQKALEVAEREGRFEGEGARVRKDGSIFLAHVIVEPIRDEAGRLVGFAKITRDATDRQRVIDAEQASEAKTQFLASMSHEIRTPLNGIIGYTERLIDEPLTPDQRRFIERIQTAGSALLTIINDILNFSQIEAGRIELEEHAFSLEGLLDNTVSIVAASAEAKGLPVCMSLAEDVPTLLIGDEARLRQILLNLLNNAIKFTHEGEIGLAVERVGRTGERELIRFEIRDTGIGIPPEKRDRLFKRFSQIDSSIHREFGGSGLGLAISKRLVDLMAGEIGFTSEEGRGSIFWFTVALAAAQPEELPAAEEDVAPSAASARILVAEDLDINQDLIRSVLESAGHQVDIVANGAEAVAAVAAGRYDLVLMDVQMPVMDGITATRKIRALDHPRCAIPIIAMTANVLPQQVRSFRQAGMDDHLGKPMKRNAVLAKVNEWLPATSITEASTTGPPTSRPFFDEDAFSELREMVGPERMSEWLKRLAEQLEATFAYTRFGSISRNHLRARSHAIVSQAGNIGFLELADLCRNLEEACTTGRGLRLAFDKSRSAARTAVAMIPKLLDGLQQNNG